jgi:hypothetical protein
VTSLICGAVGDSSVIMTTDQSTFLSAYEDSVKGRGGAGTSCSEARRECGIVTDLIPGFCVVLDVGGSTLNCNVLSTRSRSWISDVDNVSDRAYDGLCKGNRRKKQFLTLGPFVSSVRRRSKYYRLPVVSFDAMNTSI